MLIKCNAHDHLYLIDDDPVRGTLFKDSRIRFDDPFAVYAEINEETGEIAAVVCVVVCKFIPQDEDQLRLIAGGRVQEIEEQMYEALEGSGGDGDNLGTVVCPYTIWSYQRGHGRNLINNLLEAVPILHPEADALITMSPHTKTALKFHVGNGAVIVGHGEGSVNYEYDIPEVTLH